MKKNINSKERILRFIISTIFLILAITTKYTIIFSILTIIALTTAILQYCPIYDIKKLIRKK